MVHTGNTKAVSPKISREPSISRNGITVKDDIEGILNSENLMYVAMWIDLCGLDRNIANGHLFSFSGDGSTTFSTAIEAVVIT